VTIVHQTTNRPVPIIRIMRRPTRSTRRQPETDAPKEMAVRIALCRSWVASDLTPTLSRRTGRKWLTAPLPDHYGSVSFLISCCWEGMGEIVKTYLTEERHSRNAHHTPPCVCRIEELGVVPPALVGAVEHDLLQHFFVREEDEGRLAVSITMVDC